MEIFPKDYCIFIASHLKNTNRIPYLCDCLTSIVQQHMKTTIHLSISFETPEIITELDKQLQSNHMISTCGFLNIYKRPEKTSQMHHFYLLLENCKHVHEWIMFCDDDDTYEQNRTFHIAQIITTAKQQMKNEKMRQLHLAGVYESTFGKSHRQHRHEYWCYCVHKQLLEEFYNVVYMHPEVLNDKCCDVLFAEYLRRKSNDWIFLQLPVKYYNYRIENNADSVTGNIKSKQSKYTLTTKPPDFASDAWAEYVFGWNDYVHENMPGYLHDTYLRSIVGCSLDAILQSEFLANYPLLPFVDKDHEEKISKKHAYLRDVCNQLYDIKL